MISIAFPTVVLLIGGVQLTLQKPIVRVDGSICLEEGMCIYIDIYMYI